MKAKNFCWLSFGLCLAFAATLALPSGAAAQVRIMPLGNSITDGDGSTNGGGYRYFLYNKLKDANISFDFVGSLTSGSGFPDNNHEGHAGFRADQLTAPAYLTANPPEVVFLEVGTNDVSNSESATQIRDEIAAIIDQIHSFDARIEIYLGTLIPRKDSNGLLAATDNLNALLPGLVSAKSTAGYKIYLVDHAARFKADPNWKTNLLSDNLHPNDAGYDLMAQEWFTAYVSNSGAPVTQFSDNFDSGGLGSAWVANSAFKVQNGQLVNTSTADAFDHFIAVPSVINNANVVQFTYGSQSDFIGRAYTGAAVMLDAASTDANGYLIFHNSELKRVRLYNVVNGVPGQKIAEAVAQAPDPDAGQAFRLEWTTDANGHHFCVYINNVLDACVSDENKLQGNAAKLYAGVMANGNTNNAIDDFYTAKVSDSTPPAAVNNLKVTAVSALSATLEWTAPGDDGNTGQARSYQLRYSTAPITAANFNDATPVPNLPQPGPAGTIQSVAVAGLASGATYYFALKTADEFGNLSALSNVVSANTTALNVLTDNFNRQGPELGDNWAAEPEMQIINGTVQNTSRADVWSAAIYKNAKNPLTASIKWGPKATLYGTNWCGVLVMANQANSAQADGYMIQRYDEGGVTRLWRVSNGQFAGVIDEGNSLAPDPKPGSVMKVVMNSDNTGHHFDVFINDVFDRALTDPQKLEGNTSPLYAGFYLNSPLDSLNAIDSFSAGILPGTPTTLVKVSGDNQTKPVGQALPQPLVVTLLDQNQNPMAGMLVNFVVASGSATVNNPPAADDNIRLEAENALITAPIETRNDADAAGGKYIVYPTGQTADASATLTFVINNAGSYRVWTRSQKTGAQAGSWTISVDGGNDFIYDVFQGSTRSAWTWDLLSERRSNGTQIDPKILNLSAGTHTIEFKARWEDTRLDKILITSDAGFTPDGKEEVGYITDANGVASAKVTMGTKAGTVQINAVHGNLPPATFTATATVAAADSLVLAGGSGQSGPAGQTLAQPLKVKTTDRFGNAVANKSVSWIVTQGNGKLGNYTSESDADGIATTTFTPGNRSATNKVSARAAYAGSEVEFTATTTAGIADAAAIVSGSGQAGTVGSALTNPLVIKVTDATGKAVANYPVEAIVTRGGGTVSASNLVRNGSFENLSSGAPANWNLEGSPSADEVSLSNDARTGSRSLRVNSTRAGVGVSQLFNYDANTGYTLSFWAKMRRGAARVLWRLNDGSGNQTEEMIDIIFTAADSVWRQYTVSAQNGVAGARNLWIRTTDAGEFFIDDVKILRNTGGNGQLSMAWTLGDTVMTQQVVVNDGAFSDNRGSLKGFPLVFTAKAQASAPKTLAIQNGNGQIGSAGQPLPVPLTVKVADDFGNGVEKVNVTFTATVGNGHFENQNSTLTVPTDSAGLAKAILTMGPTAGATNTVVATAQGLSNASVTFNAIAAIPSQLAAAPNVTEGSAGYPVPTPLTVRVTDNSSNRISGFPVVFTVQEGGGNIDGQTTATIRTDANGEAKAALVLGPNPNTQNKVVVTATHNGQALQGSGLTLTVTSAKLKDLLLSSGNDQTGIAGEPLPKLLRAKIQDALGKGIKGQNVTFTVIVGDGKFSGNVTTKTVRTDSLGIAGISWILGPVPGQNNHQARATTTPALNGSPVVFTASAKVGPPIALKEISGDSISGVAGNPLPAPFITQVTDKVGNGIANVPVIFTVKSGGGSFDGVTKDTVRTDQDGNAQITLTTGSTVGRFNNVVEARAFNGSLELTNSPMLFVASATLSSARTITLQSGNRQIGRAGQPLANPFTVKILDRNSNPVATHPVHFRVVRGGGVFANGKADTTVNSDASGLAKALLTLGGAILPDSQVVFVSANDGVDNLLNSPISFVVTATAGLPSGTASYVEATSPVPADGASECNVKVFVLDRFGNPVPNVSVTIQVAGESKTFPNVNTDARGNAVFKFASTRAGRKTISLMLNGQVLGRSASVLFAPLAAQQINLIAGQAQTGNVNTALPKPLSVQVLDKFNNGVPEHSVDFVIEAGNGRFLKPSPVLTDSTGMASVTYVLGGGAGENRVRAGSIGLNNSPIIFVATAVNAAPANLEYLGGNNQEAVAGQVLPQPLAVKVIDANKRAVYNVPVNFAVNFGGGTVDGSNNVTVRTNEFGEARVVWQLGPGAGINTVRASTSGLTGSPIDFQAIAASGAAKNLLAFSGDGASGQINQEMPTPLAVRITDDNNNGVDGIHVFFELIQGSGTLAGGSGTPLTRDVTSSGGGFASTKITFGAEIGARQVRITVQGLSSSPLVFTMSGRAGALKTIETVARSNNQNGTANRPLNFPLQVIAYDEQRNPVEGAQINFAVTQNTGYFPGGALQTSILTNSKGIAEVEWTIKAGANKVQASAIALPSSPLTFDATGVTNNNFPILADVPNQQKVEGDRLEFVVRATDDDNDPIRYGARNLPLGAVFDSLGTRIFTWQTDASSAGHYEISFMAYDTRGGVDEEIVSVDILNRNRSPLIVSRFPVGSQPGQPDTTLQQPGTPLRMRVTASDPDGDVLSYRWYVNGKFAGSVFDTFDFRGDLTWNYVEAVVFDLVDTVRTVWSIKVPVELASFTANAGDGPGVKLSWITGSEINNVGFNILRSSAQSGRYTKLNDQLIPANRDGRYTFLDNNAEAGARYYYKLEALDTRGNVTTHGPIVVTVAAPTAFDLSQNYPNPFSVNGTFGNPSTSIKYQLPQAVQVRLTIYNMLGQEVRKLVNTQQPAGYHTVVWDGRDNAGRRVPSGVYHYRLQAGNFTVTKRMLMAK